MSSGLGIPSYFEEEAYLYYNPDVAAAVAAGAVESGYHHWLFYGSGEPRRGAPWKHAADRRVFTSQFQKRSFGVNLFGFLSTPSGLGQAARSCHTALASAGIPVHAINVPPWHEADAPRVAPPPEQQYRINVIQQNADMMRSFLRSYGEEMFHGAYNIPFWFWELPSMLPDWFPYYEYADEIWVASEFCRRSISSITRLPVTRMPLVIEGLEKRLAYSRSHFGLPPSTFVFGYIYDVNSYVDRKNPIALVEAFRREFGSSTDVLLVLKQSYGGSPRNSGADRVNGAISGAPNIRILDGDFDDQEITSFQNALDCFVSPHRTEGFGFNLAECMYLRKPVIATGYSGNVDFTNEANSYPVDYRLVPIKHTAGPYRKGSMWAEPSVDHLCRQMRNVFENASERERKAAAASETIRTNYSSAEAGRHMDTRFRDLGLDQPRVQRSLFSQHSTREPQFVHPDTPTEIRQQIRAMPTKPLISVLMSVPDTPASELRERVVSVQQQWYSYWELCICDEGSTNAETLSVLDHYRGLDPRIKIILNNGMGASEIARGDHVVREMPDPLTPDALLNLARTLTPS